MRQFNSITIEQYNNKKIAFPPLAGSAIGVIGDNLKVRFSVVRKVFYTFLYHKKGVTLVELLIALCIFALIVIGFSSIDTFSRYHVVSSDRRAKLQNDASFILEHMAKNIGKAIGDVTNVPVVIDDSNRRIKVYIDNDGNGQRSAGDRWVAYRYRDSSAPAIEQYQIWYCPQCTDSTCDTCNPVWGTSDNTLSKKINSFTPTYSSTDNYVDINITARWDPAQAASSDNPNITMRNRINMPAVSTN